MFEARSEETRASFLFPPEKVAGVVIIIDGFFSRFVANQKWHFVEFFFFSFFSFSPVNQMHLVPCRRPVQGPTTSEAERAVAHPRSSRQSVFSGSLYSQRQEGW